MAEAIVSRKEAKKAKAQFGMSELMRESELTESSPKGKKLPDIIISLRT